MINENIVGMILFFWTLFGGILFAFTYANVNIKNIKLFKKNLIYFIGGPIICVLFVIPELLKHFFQWLEK